jgi:hypothetical protein
LSEKRLFEPGDLVRSFTGEVGIVISKEKMEEVTARFKEGRRLGRFFSPGCCSNPDYVTQVPVFFEDGTFNVMRSMNLKRGTPLPEDKREKLQEAMES